MLFNLIYDRYGNRWQQNITQGSGPQPQLSFNASNNQVVGYQYDAVGNVINDGVHTYTYDAENNLISIDGGATATYVYDALNERVKVSTSTGAQEYGYDLSGRRSTVWVPGSTNVNAVQYYAGSNRVAYWTASDGNIHFEHQDWLGTERMRTSATASVDGSYSSLPYGDNLQVSGSDTNPGHFAMLDQDVSASSGLSHAMFREYSETAGRWMSSDSYLGSYYQHNPQSFNRYAYTLNNPLSFIDPFGLSCLFPNGAPNSLPPPSSTDSKSDPAQPDYANDQAACEAAGGTWVDGDGGSVSVSADTDNASLSYLPSSSLIDESVSGLIGGGVPSNGPQPDKKPCSARLAAGVQKNTGVTPTNLQYTGTVGGHANYTFDVSDPTGFQSILNQNMPWSWAGPLDEGHRYGLIQSTHILDPLNGSYSGHTDLFNGHSILAPLHWIVDVGIGHIPGVNLDFGCKAGS